MKDSNQEDTKKQSHNMSDDVRLLVRVGDFEIQQVGHCRDHHERTERNELVDEYFDRVEVEPKLLPELFAEAADYLLGHQHFEQQKREHHVDLDIVEEDVAAETHPSEPHFLIPELLHLLLYHSTAELQ